MVIFALSKIFSEISFRVASSRPTFFGFDYRSARVSLHYGQDWSEVELTTRLTTKERDCIYIQPFSPESQAMWKLC